MHIHRPHPYGEAMYWCEPGIMLAADPGSPSAGLRRQIVASPDIPSRSSMPGANTSVAEVNRHS